MLFERNIFPGHSLRRYNALMYGCTLLPPLIVVFNVPTVAKTSAHNTKSSKILQCQFNASTMKDITFVVWMKGDVAINSSDHYKIRTFTKPTIDDLIISELTINNIIASDQGKYSCYCYYNKELVMAKNPVISEQQSFSVYFKKRECLCILQIL